MNNYLVSIVCNIKPKPDSIPAVQWFTLAAIYDDVAWDDANSLVEKLCEKLANGASNAFEIGNSPEVI